jgi:Holliday junction resolvase RusA-like endonuclease
MSNELGGRVFGMTVLSRSIPKGRARVSKSGHMYTPERTRLFEKYIANLAAMSLVYSTAEYPLSIRVVAEQVPPKSWPKWHKAAAAAGLVFPSGGDTDNRLKAIKDALNTIVYADDKQIPDIAMSVRYGVRDVIRIDLYRVGVTLEEAKALYAAGRLSYDEVNRRGVVLGGHGSAGVPMRDG